MFKCPPVVWIIALVLSVLGVGVLGETVIAASDDMCSDLDGAVIWSQENTPTYLGFFGNKYAYESIYNPYGIYGSKYNPQSVRNTLGTYGSPYNMYSANNHLASKPPVIVKSGYILAYLSTNTFISGYLPLAYIDANCEFYSSSASGALPPPPAPAWFTASDGEYSDKVIVQWAAVSGATQYAIGVQAVTDGEVQFLDPTTSTSMNIVGLEPEHVYTFGVTAVGPNGNSTFVFDTGWMATPAPSTFTLSVVRSGSGNGTVTSNPVGISCGPTCSAGYTAGSQVQLIAAPNADSSFTGWSGGGCSGTGSCTVTVNNDLTVTAQFTAKPPDPPTNGGQHVQYLPTVVK